MKDSTNQAYDAWPDRLYIVDTNGRIALKGERGPRGFSPSVDYAREWLKDYELTMPVQNSGAYSGETNSDKAWAKKVTASTTPLQNHYSEY